MTASFTDTFMALHSARRALRTARAARTHDALAGAHRLVFDDVVTSLAREVEKCERDAVALVGRGIMIAETGAAITVEVDDRRARARPRFLYRNDRGNVPCDCGVCMGRRR